MAHPLDSIRAKIKRANQHIRNLDAEITTYLDGADHSFTSTLQYDAGKGGYIRNLVFSGSPFPQEFSIVIGEAIHQLRSSLDHLVWQLVLAKGTEAPTDKLEFPVFWEREKYPAAARRKIKGVSPSAADLIESLQPWHAAIDKVKDHPLFILHDLDRIDKHQLLILTAGEVKIFGAQTVLTRELDKVVTYKLTRTLTAHPDTDYQACFDIAFDTFGNRKGEPVIPSLQQLAAFVSGVVDSFKAEFK